MNNHNLKYDSSLDNNETLKKQADYYDKKDAFDVGNKSKMLVSKHNFKRVCMNIPEDIYSLALKLSSESGAGYQNILKVAMYIGVNELLSKNKPGS